MATLGDIRRALRDRIEALVPEDVRVFPFVPDGVVVPCVWIEPDRTTTEFQIAFNTGSGEIYNLLLTILTNRIDEESAQDALDLYVDPDGPFKTGLEQGTNDQLAGLISYLDVLKAIGYGTYKVGDTFYFGIQLVTRVTT